MAHDVFISHSAKDKTIADTVCATLEAKGLCCWIAPRDIRPGETWTTSIVRAIKASRLMVLVFSSNTNAKADMVLREVEMAAKAAIPIIPLRVEDVAPTEELEFFLSTPHWLDAFPGPNDHHLAQLVESVQAFVQAPQTGAAKPAAAATSDGAAIPATSSAATTQVSAIQAGAKAGFATGAGGLAAVVGSLFFGPAWGAAVAATSAYVANKKSGGAAAPAVLVDMTPLTAADFTMVLGLSKQSRLADAEKLFGAHQATDKRDDGSVRFIWKNADTPWLVFNPGAWVRVHHNHAPNLPPNSAIARLAAVPNAQRTALLPGFQEASNGFWCCGNIRVNPWLDSILVAWD